MGDFLTAMLISVMASVVGYYICKWLDGNDQTATAENGSALRNEQEPPESHPLRGFVLAL